MRIANHVKIKRAFAAVLGIATCFLASASHASESAACYRLSLGDTPEATAMATEPQTQIWCYQNLSVPAGARFIFNADSDEVKPELAALLEADGTLTHGSLAGGKLRVARVDSKVFNPLQVPLVEPVQTAATATVDLEKLAPSIEQTLKFLSSPAMVADEMTVETGEFSASVPDYALPWRGYWWPYKNQPLSGTTSSPMSKYDRFVRSRTGASPAAASWENGNHRYKGISWEGHCNGWAASSILRAEPKVARYDAFTGITFSVSDQKGLLAEKDYCAKVAFFGNRYRGSKSNLYDISPALFHKTLTYYIGALGKPIAFDYNRSSPVDNHVMSGYHMTITRSSSGRLYVVADVTTHKYDGMRSQTPGVAPSYTRHYKYYLTTNEFGEIVKGSWVSSNPDFLWVPLSPMDCSRNNPRIKTQWLDAVLALPQVQTPLPERRSMSYLRE